MADQLLCCCLVGSQLPLQKLTVPIGYLILKLIDLQDPLHAHIQTLKQMANLLDAGLLLGIDLVALGLAATEMAVGSPGRVPAVALLADDAVAVQDVATTGLVAGLA